MNPVEELLVVLMDAAWVDAPQNIREHGEDLITRGLQILLGQFKLPYGKRDHELIRTQWNVVNRHGRQTGLFKGLDVSPDCLAEFKRFIENKIH